MTSKKHEDFSFAKEYSKFRTDYSDTIFDETLKRLQGKRDLAIDVGAGTGQASFPLTKYFKEVIAYDPSEGLIKQGKESNTYSNLRFEKSSAESIDLPDGSVDLIVSAQAVHWFDLIPFYEETKRILRTGGLLAIWGYAKCSITNHEQADALWVQYFNHVRPYYESGRDSVDNHYRDILPTYPQVERLEIDMPKVVTVDALLGYAQTSSAYNRWKELHPNDQNSPSDPFIHLQNELNHLKINHNLTLNFPVFMIFCNKL